MERIGMEIPWVLGLCLVLCVPKAAAQDKEPPPRKATKSPSTRKAAPRVRGPRRRPVRRPARRRPPVRIPVRRRAPAKSPTRSYLRGVKMYKAKKWAEAGKAFGESLELTKVRAAAAKKKGGQQYHLLLLGKYDLYYWLSRVDAKQKKMRSSCRWLQKLQSGVKALPKDWENWTLPPELAGRLKQAGAFLEFCASVASLVRLKAVPPKAKITVAAPKSDGSWGWKPHPYSEGDQPQEVTLPWKARKLKVRIAVPGYELWEKEIDVPRWHEVELSYSPTAKKPAPRARVQPVRRRVEPPRRAPDRRVARIQPPTRRPSQGSKKKGFFSLLPTWGWIAIGAGAGVVLTTVIIAAAASQGIDQVEPVISLEGLR